MQLFLDCDGVLANFDKKAEEVMGMPSRKFEEEFGAKEFWKRIYSVPDFFFILEPMPDAYDLVGAVRHLNPIILTGKPSDNKGFDGTEQKLRWRDKCFPDLEMIVCPSRDKIKHAKPGDVIVDDWEKWRHLWIEGGGIWVMHTSAEDSIRQLKDLKII
ncbi:hypothetical protein UFOVP787_56 [uncultured Caudovirales phage]|uniref:Uncharacterized protein n=1 Tax=uncultured Caudovirales phage TaxID=2100421 RepID=A0A6J5NU84_9CAUD|nr:hypothetical protein UFOVP787_56 [uncultured Caudovirales phage]